MVTWRTCRSFFAPDGSLRDIYVPGGGLPTWNALLGLAREARARFTVDGAAHSLPASPQEALAFRPVASPLLSIPWNGIVLNAHFFDPNDVEIDLEPAEINSAARFEAVILTPENCMNSAYLEVHPVSGAIRSAS